MRVHRYPRDHVGYAYLMLNPENNRVHTTRDVIWLKRFYYKTKATHEVANDPLILVLDHNALSSDMGDDATSSNMSDYDGLSIASVSSKYDSSSDSSSSPGTKSESV